MRYLSLGQQKVLYALALIILIIIYFQFYYHSSPRHSGEFDQEIVVEVLGEVRNPEIYLFEKPPTLREAIEKAGGLMEAALFSTVSSSETLETGTLITILKESRDEIKVKLGRMEARKLLIFSIPLDLNRVSEEDLCLIPGIGETLAHEIVTYRERRREFQSVDELKNVKGIGENNWKDFKKFFVVK
jgi:competence protein ComEA